MYRQLFTYFVLIFLFLSTASVAQVNADLQLRLDKTLDSMRIRIKSAALSGGMVLPDGSVWTSASVGDQYSTVAGKSQLSIWSACALSAENATQFSPTAFEAGCDVQAARNRIRTRKTFLSLNMEILLSIETLGRRFCSCYF